MVASADRVRVSWEGTGTGTMSLGAAVNSAFIAPPSSLNGLTVSYLIEHQGEETTELEWGRGVYSHSGTTLTRASVVGSTNGGSLVSFSAGVKHVSFTLLASDLGGRFISTLTETTIDGANDFIEFWDATDSARKKVKPDNLPSAALGMREQVPIDLSGGDVDYTLLASDGIGRRITFVGGGGNGRVVLPNDIEKTGNIAPYWLVQSDIDTVTGIIEIHVDAGATVFFEGEEVAGATELGLEFPSLYFISLIKNANGTSAFYQVDRISQEQSAVPTPGVTTVEGTNHRLTDAEKTSQNHTVLIDNSDAAATIVVPEDASAGDSWFLDNASEGTITIVVAEGSGWEEPVKSQALSTPPIGSPSPAVGDRYIVAAGSPAAAWDGHAEDIAEWDGAAWVFTDPVEGMTTWVEDELAKYAYVAGEWGSTSGTALINGEEYRQLSGTGRAGLIWVRSNPTSTAPFARIEGETVADTVAQGDHDADGHAIRNVLFESEVLQTVTSSAGTLAVNLALGNQISHTLTANVTTHTLSNIPTTGRRVALVYRIIQNASNFTMVWPAAFDWGAIGAPTLAAGAGSVTWVVAITGDGGTRWDAMLSFKD